MPKIAIVTDSTAGFTENKIGNVPVISVPLDIIWGNKTYKDGVDLHSDEIYHQIKNSKQTMPTTNQPSLHDFYAVYKELLDEGYEIISIHISMGISHTLNSAVQAKKMFQTDVPIEIHDSYVTTVVLKMLLFEAAKAIEAGKSLSEVADTVRSARERADIYFTVKNLDHLVHGGRVTPFQSFLGKLLHIRPIFTFRNGKIVTVKSAITFAGALRAIERSFKKTVKGRKVRYAFATYTDNKNFVTHFFDNVLKRSGVEKTEANFVDPLSTVIAAHTGPGCIGLGFLVEED